MGNVTSESFDCDQAEDGRIQHTFWRFGAKHVVTQPSPGVLMSAVTREDEDSDTDDEETELSLDSHMEGDLKKYSRTVVTLAYDGLRRRVITGELEDEEARRIAIWRVHWMQMAGYTEVPDVGGLPRDHRPEAVRRMWASLNENEAHFRQNDPPGYSRPAPGVTIFKDGNMTTIIVGRGATYRTPP